MECMEIEELIQEEMNTSHIGAEVEGKNIL